MKAIAAVALMGGGCSLLLQSTLPDHHHADAEPTCTTGDGLAYVDLALGALNGAGAIAAANDQSAGDKTTLGALIDAVIFTASGIYGFSEASKCRDAVARYQRVVAERKQDRRVTDRDDLAELRAAHRAPEASVASAAARAAPRGFFCASSSGSAVSVCARERAVCEQARGVTIGVVPDLASCALVELAYCFDAGSGDDLERCAATAASCALQRDTAIADNSDAFVGEYAEQK